MRTRGSLIVIALATVAVLGFFAWAAWAHLDQITRARGQVIPTGRVQSVQAAAEGTVNAIMVKEGDRVAKGQLLVALDQVSVGAAVQRASAGRPGRYLGASERGGTIVVRWEYPGGRVADIMVDGRTGRVIGER